jgi:MerR family transcriptional regulator, light-induced transcriptional regulator
MSQAAAAGDPSEDGLPIGAVAARLGVAAGTLRSWGTRYGLTPSLRTAGGHRRYSSADLAVLETVRASVREGMTPAEAAAAALTAVRADPATTRPSRTLSQRHPRRRRAGPGGRVLGVPGSDAETRGLARAASQLDLDGAEEVIVAALRSRGVVRAWDELVRPVLDSAGRRWAETGQGVEVEHVLSEATVGALRRRRVELDRPPTTPLVLLAAAPGDQHTLVLQALAVGLAERGRRSQVLGAQVPVTALASVVRRTRPAAVFVSCAMDGAADPHQLLAALPRTRPALRVVVGGSGWPPDLPQELHAATDLGDALDLLTR